MEKLLNRIQYQLNENHYVEKQDIQTLLDQYKFESEMHHRWKEIAELYKETSDDYKAMIEITTKING